MEEQKQIKPFKTISLVDKLKGSIYDKDPKTVVPSNKIEGSPAINTIPKTQDKENEGISLPLSQKTLPREGAILKSLIDAPPSNLPEARTRFASTLSLANRLRQPISEVGNPPNTAALPSYFLSDLYTGYIDISKFLTSPIDSTQNPTTTDLPISVSNILAIQNPDIQLTTPTGDGTILIEQGTIFKNGSFESLIQKEERESNDTILQLQGTFFTNEQFLSLTQTETPVVIVNQGEVDLPIWNYVTNQGETLSLETPNSSIQIAVLQGMLESNGIILGSIIEPSELETLSLENSTIPSLDIVAYETDRLLAFASPKIKHGSGIIEVTRHDGDKLQSQENPETKQGVTETLNNPSAPKTIDNIAEGNNKALINKPAPGERIDAEAGQEPIPFPKITGDTNITLQQFSPQKYDVNPGDEGNLKQFGITAFTTSESNLPISHYTNALPIIFTPEGGSPIKVPCYLTSFSDGFGASWNDVTYVGRQDTLKQFKGVTRAVSFGILVPSFSRNDLTRNMAMINKLADATVIGNMSGKYIKGPLCKLKIGKLINSYCAFSSLKWEYDPAEATTDIDAGLPHLLKVSFEAAVLADRNDKLLGSKSGDYFGSRY